MKFILTLIMCSYTEGLCMPGYQWPKQFDSTYDCMMFGYKESMNKMNEVGRVDVNKHQIYIKFTCSPVETI